MGAGGAWSAKARQDQTHHVPTGRSSELRKADQFHNRAPGTPDPVRRSLNRMVQRICAAVPEHRLTGLTEIKKRLELLAGAAEAEREKRKKRFFYSGVSIGVFLILGTASFLLFGIVASYTYGPLLGLYMFGLFTKINVHDKVVPFIAIASPVLCYIISANSERWFNGYKMGYELLIVNALITIAGLIIIKKKRKTTD